MKRILLVLVFFASLASLAGLPEWTGERIGAWKKSAHQISGVKVQGGALVGSAAGRDAFFAVGCRPFAPTPTQEVVFRAKCAQAGLGEFFWATEKMKSPVQRTSARFEWIGDGQWHEYRVRPFWQGEGRISQLRIDFPGATPLGSEVAIRDVRVVDEIAGESRPVGDAVGLTFTYASKTAGKGVFEWASDAVAGRAKVAFRLSGDGRNHRYFVDLSGKPQWTGKVAWSRLYRKGEETPLPVEGLRFYDSEPESPADLMTVGVNFVTPACRVGTEGRIEASVQNLGTLAAEDVALALVDAPAFVTCAPASAVRIPGNQVELLALTFRATAPFAGSLKVELRQAGKAVASFDVPVRVAPSLGLEKAAYVPEPKPAKTGYDLAALYFPGWEKASAWKRVWKTCPERRPVLGWYDETKSEVVDWQIKWLVECGIRTLYVDWYWVRGYQHHDHWVKAFQKAKYRRLLKWALMWANHTEPGTHSVEDQRAVVKFWIENYFNTPEYLTRDGMPVVWLWQPGNMDRDLGKGGCRKLLELSRQMAREAGYKGIWFIAMKFPEADCSAGLVSAYAKMGFDETGIYHFMTAYGKEESPDRFSFARCADANPTHWRERRKAGVLPFMPSLSTGWDDRPWNDHLEIYGKNVADFRRICREAKTFADETGVKRLCVGPLNEWGEGSYAEPNAEHGFGFYDALRETFCERPAEGWAPNVTPADVGLGPYDLPLPEPPKPATAWTFAGTDAGWKVFMGGKDVTPTPEGLAFKTASRDPAMETEFAAFDAVKYRTVTVRMKLENARGRTQLFWGRDRSGMRGVASALLPVVSDGLFHDYTFRLEGHRHWKGRIGSLRLDPCENAGAGVVVASIRLEK